MDTGENLKWEMEKLGNGWKLSDNSKKISKEFFLPDFLPALDFVRLVGEDAEKRDHHPDIHIYLRKVVCELTTYDAAGTLTAKDFDAAKSIDQIFEQFNGETTNNQT